MIASTVIYKTANPLQPENCYTLDWVLYSRLVHARSLCGMCPFVSCVQCRLQNLKQISMKFERENILAVHLHNSVHEYVREAAESGCKGWGKAVLGASMFL